MNPANSSAAQELAALQAQMLRPAQEVNREGSFELGLGVTMLCFGVVPYFSAVVTKSAFYSPRVTWILYLPFLVAVFAPYAVPKLIKRFITWPRTGYVANPGEVKLGQLVVLLVFGLAVGGAVGQVLILIIGMREARGVTPSVTLTCTKLFLYAIAAVYLGRKVVRKRRLPPAAYDATIINEGLKQTAGGRKTLRLVRFTIVAVVIGLPILVTALVFGLVFGTKALLRHSEIRWSQLAFPGLLVASSTLLYWMGSGVMLKPHRWKWFMVPVMLLVPILVAPAIPYPVINQGLFPMLEMVSPVTLCLGAVWLLSGTIALLLFMHHNHLPAVAA